MEVSRNEVSHRWSESLQANEEEAEMMRVGLELKIPVGHRFNLGTSLVPQIVGTLRCLHLQCRRPRFNPWVGKIR